MAGPIVIRKSLLHLNYPGPLTVDLSCYAIALEITPNIEDLDVGTFCNPSAMVHGRVTYSATATLLWEPALYTLLQVHIGEAALCVFAPDAAVMAAHVQFNTRFSSQPWGRFELGQRVEVELPLAVLDTPVWMPGTMEEPQTLPAPEPPDTAEQQPVEEPGASPKAEIEA
jgi:hypothetical protein